MSGLCEHALRRVVVELGDSIRPRDERLSPLLFRSRLCSFVFLVTTSIPIPVAILPLLGLLEFLISFVSIEIRRRVQVDAQSAGALFIVEFL